MKLSLQKIEKRKQFSKKFFFVIKHILKDMAIMNFF